MARSLTTKTLDLGALVQARAAQVDAALHKTLHGLKDLPQHGKARPPPRLVDAMGHSLLAGGKRLRPVLCLEACVAVGGKPAWAMASACALEMVHTYSLIHDDLPAMDDDDLRRGRPTVHKAFDEATAILAGDGLLTDAFLVISGAKHRALEQVVELAAAAGSAGMVGGQMADIEAEGMSADAVDLEAIHRRKTGRLFVASVVLGGHSGKATPTQLRALGSFGAWLGLAFQVWDDVLDVEDVTGKGGKGVGRDERHDKATYVRRHGLDGAKEKAHAAAQAAVKSVRALGPKADVLRALARYSVERDR